MTNEENNMKKTTLAAQGGTGIIVLALLSALAQANSVRYSDISMLELDMASAAIAASEAIVGDIIEAELEMDDAKALWEIDIVNDANQVITVEVDGQSGQILSTRFEGNTELTHADVLSLANAIDIVKAVEKGALVEAELEQDHGEMIWEIETLGDNNQEMKFRVHAETGEILI